MATRRPTRYSPDLRELPGITMLPQTQRRFIAVSPLYIWIE